MPRIVRMVSSAFGIDSTAARSGAVFERQIAAMVEARHKAVKIKIGLSPNSDGSALLPESVELTRVVLLSVAVLRIEDLRTYCR